METDLISAKKKRVTFIAVLLFSTMLANFVFWSGFALGFFITVFVGEILIFTLLPLPQSRRTIIASAFFGLSTSALALTFLLFSDYLLLVLNFFVIVLLLLIQLLIHSEALEADWNTPKFLLELFISPFIRPFRFLPEFIKMTKTFRKQEDALHSGTEPLPPKRHVTRNILLGLLAAVPFLAVVILLLSSADVVFGKYFGSMIDFIRDLNIGEVVFTVVLAAFMFPFLYSFIHSYANKWKESSVHTAGTGKDSGRFRIDPVIASTFLVCMNIVYGIFTWVQFSSLFGAFADALPEELTYAEYAREGFFQLAFVACINVVLVILGVMATSRKGAAGIMVRILSVLMIAFTYVLLVSAGYRMNMYISVFALTKMRLLVSIFMVLIGTVLLYALIKEFWVGFKFTKFAFISAVIILLLTNFLNPSASIAEYNTQYHGGLKESDARYSIDTSYLVFELSFDAVPSLLDLAGSGSATNKTDIESDLLEVYSYYLRDYREDNWRKFNVSKECAKIAIEEYFGNDLAKELEKYGLAED